MTFSTVVTKTFQSPIFPVCAANESILDEADPNIRNIGSPFFTLKRVALLVMLAQIQSHVFFLFRHSQSHDSFEYPENDHGSDGRKDPRRDNRHNLGPELARVAEEKTVVTRSINRFGRKQACSQRAPGSTDSVDADDVQGIVVAALCFQVTSRITKYSTADTD